MIITTDAIKKIRSYSGDQISKPLPKAGVLVLNYETFHCIHLKHKGYSTLYFLYNKEYVNDTTFLKSCVTLTL